jgi:hypothetical protein
MMTARSNIKEHVKEAAYALAISSLIANPAPCANIQSLKVHHKQFYRLFVPRETKSNSDEN